jgi:hypothetical protein
VELKRSGTYGKAREMRRHENYHRSPRHRALIRRVSAVSQIVVTLTTGAYELACNHKAWMKTPEIVFCAIATSL